MGPPCKRPSERAVNAPKWAFIMLWALELYITAAQVHGRQWTAAIYWLGVNLINVALWKTMI